MLTEKQRGGKDSGTKEQCGSLCRMMNDSNTFCWFQFW